MLSYNFESPCFVTTEDQEVSVREWQARYRDLTEVLGNLGSLVSVVRVRETDQDISPYRFMRGAAHEFVFPPQETRLLEDTSEIIDPTPGYKLEREARVYDYDEDRVEGHIRLYYDDAGGQIEFGLSDQAGKSNVPDGALLAIEKAFAQPVESRT